MLSVTHRLPPPPPLGVVVLRHRRRLLVGRVRSLHRGIVPLLGIRHYRRRRRRCRHCGGWTILPGVVQRHGWVGIVVVVVDGVFREWFVWFAIVGGEPPLPGENGIGTESFLPIP